MCHNLTGGGAERVAVSISNGLCALDNNVMLLTDLTQPISYNPSDSVQLTQVEKRSNALKRRIAWVNQIKNILEEKRPDVIISILSYLAIEARIATWLTGFHIPIVLSEHNSFERPASAPFSFRERLRKFWLNYLYEHITVLTEADLICLNGRFRSVTVMTNPLCLSPVKSVPNKNKTILAVGRLDAWHYKGFDVLLSAWSEIEKKYPEWTLRIIGHGDNANISYLKSLVQDTNRIEIEPYTTNIIDEYQHAAIFVLSSRYEGFGLVLIEAMSQGCACIACDYKGRQAEIITNGLNGLLCEPDNKTDLQNKLERMITDKDLREHIQNNAITSLEKYREDKIAKRWNNFLHDIIDINK